ncbi:PAS domain-containing protein [Palleronia sediminis]|uniref:PAS domain-containing protein n=1 Tax=Palleronia sediminis TaxID=2547833 RepID=A0A4R6A7U9_9RHOB|nr:PAS domain-containing protein [Palleronia sediminis]TDL78288.1 PAS domain-containing protein [Palleronia sediminis]
MSLTTFIATPEAWLAPVVLNAALSAMAGIGAAAWLARRAGPGAPPAHETRAAFLLDGRGLLDATPAGRAMLDEQGAGWSRDGLLGALERMVPGVGAALDDLPERRSARLAGPDVALALDLRAEGERVRLVLDDSEAAAVALDGGAHAAMTCELAQLRDLAQAIPHPVWRTGADGRIAWVNRAYLDQAGREDRVQSWPPRPIFDELPDRDGPAEARDGSAWTVARRAAADGHVFTAIPAAAQAELRSFRRTVSQVFATLSVGLAIFDRHGTLATFNPALAEMTGVPFTDLSARPTLATVLDAMRMRGAAPDAAAFETFRNGLDEMMKTGTDRGVSDLWHLPGGRTWRVGGRLQPDGALALMLENVSTEIDTTRRFRAQIDTTRAVLDRISDAIAVFDRAGVLILANEAYDAQWRLSGTDGPTHLTIRDASRAWSDACLPAPVWPDIESFVAQTGPRDGWSDSIHLRDGRVMTVSVATLPNRASLVRFAQAPALRRSVGPALPMGAAERIEDRLKA